MAIESSTSSGKPFNSFVILLLTFFSNCSRQLCSVVHLGQVTSAARLARLHSTGARQPDLFKDHLQRPDTVCLEQKVSGSAHDKQRNV